MLHAGCSGQMSQKHDKCTVGLVVVSTTWLSGIMPFIHVMYTSFSFGGHAQDLGLRNHLASGTQVPGSPGHVPLKRGADCRNMLSPTEMQAWARTLSGDLDSSGSHHACCTCCQVMLLLGNAQDGTGRNHIRRFLLTFVVCDWEQVLPGDMEDAGSAG